MRRVGRWLWSAVWLWTAACGKSAPTAAPTPASATGGGGNRPEVVDSIWAVAEKDFRTGHWEDVQLAMERVNLEMAPADPRRPRMHFLTGESMYAQGDYLQSAREFRRVSDESSSNPLAPDALLRAADSFAALWRRPELDPTYGQTALATYTEVTTRFPGTPAAKLAQRRSQELTDQFARKEYQTGRHYMKLKAYDSAILYFRDVVATYPRSSVAPSALAALVKAYYKLGYLEDVQETCGYIRRFHPNAPEVAGVCPEPPGSS